MILYNVNIHWINCVLESTKSCLTMIKQKDLEILVYELYKLKQQIRNNNVTVDQYWYIGKLCLVDEKISIIFCVNDVLFGTLLIIQEWIVENIIIIFFRKWSHFR